MKALKYIHYDFNNPDNISLIDVKKFLSIGRYYYRLTKRQNIRLLRLSRYNFNIPDNGNYFLYEYAKEVVKKQLIKKVAEICHTYAKKYKRYDIIEVLKSVRSEYNKGKCERTIFRHKIDFYKFIAHNLTVSGYDKKDISELIAVIY